MCQRRLKASRTPSQLMAEVVCSVASSFFFGALDSSYFIWGFDADRWSKQFDHVWIDSRMTAKQTRICDEMFGSTNFDHLLSVTTGNGPMETTSNRLSQNDCPRFKREMRPQRSAALEWNPEIASDVVRGSRRQLALLQQQPI